MGDMNAAEIINHVCRVLVILTDPSFDWKGVDAQQLLLLDLASLRIINASLSKLVLDTEKAK